MNEQQHSQHATPTQHQQTIPYDSNPFTISFRGFGLLVEFAKGVFITILIFGLLGFISNIASSISDFNESTQNTSVLEEIESSNAVPEAQSTDSVDAAMIISIAALVLGIFVVIMLVAVVISAAYKGFVAAGAVAASEKRMISVGQALNAMADRFGDLFKAEFISTLKIIGGFLLLIVPGVRASLRYQALPYLIMSDKNMSSKIALSESKRLYNKHLMEVFGIQFVGSIIPLVGGAFSAGGMALNAQQLKAYDTAKLQTPPTHWLNYVGLIVAAFFFFIMLFFIGLALALVGLSAS